MVVCLQAHGLGPQGRITLIGDRKTTGGQQAFGLQLFAAQAHHHDLTTKIGVEADVAQRANRNDRIGRINGHTAAIGVFQPDHVIDVRVQGQQLRLDATHRQRHDTHHTLHGGGDGQNVAGAHRAIRIAVALKRVPRERLVRRWLHGGHGQAFERARRGHLKQTFMHPAAGWNGLERIANGHVVAAHHVAFGHVAQSHFVALWHLVAQGDACARHALWQDGPGGQSAVVGNDGHVVVRMHADGEGVLCHRRGFSNSGAKARS